MGCKIVGYQFQRKISMQTMHKMSKNNDINELFSLILSLKTLEDCEILFEDLCTAKELEQMAQRVKAAKLLKEGKT